MVREVDIEDKAKAGWISPEEKLLTGVETLGTQACISAWCLLIKKKYTVKSGLKWHFDISYFDKIT